MNRLPKITLDLRAHLYFWIAFGSSFLVQTEAVHSWSDWSSVDWIRTLIGSLIGGATSLRAYIDQSLSRLPKDNQ